MLVRPVTRRFRVAAEFHCDFFSAPRIDAEEKPAVVVANCDAFCISVTKVISATG